MRRKTGLDKYEPPPQIEMPLHIDHLPALPTVIKMPGIAKIRATT
jgi:hypothetical protein